MEVTERISEKVLDNGDIYFGKFDGLLPHGNGKYTWLDGTVYDGEWEKCKMTGRGRIFWPSGAMYEGDISGGFLHGTGTYAASNGSVYEGSWRMNIQHGQGRKCYCNSDIYDGHCSEGMREGVGKYVWSNGNTYVGNWKAGKMCGRGLMKWANGDSFEGIWSDGLQHGCGIYKFADGGCYLGNWSRGLKDGLGTFFPAGCKYLYLSQLDDTSGFNGGPNDKLSHPTSRNSCDFECKNDSYNNSNMWYRWPINLYLRRSGRISHRAASVDVWNLIDIKDSSSHVSSLRRSCSYSDDSGLVYEREYVQGVLITERIANTSWRFPHGNKWQKHESDVSRRLCKTIIEGDRSYYLMLNLQLGIRYTVGKITPVPKREVRQSDFGSRARIRMHFPKKGSEFTPPHYSEGFFWKDYCPMVFRNLREMFRIDAANYMVSICGTDGLKELSSPGKSGSIFYLSQDERFVLKTLRKAELKILLKMLPQYYNHVRLHENTLITKFFGLHRITLKCGRKVRFVVMGNMFCTELHIHRRYDLKGSSHGRSTNKHKIDENTTLKDLDLSHVFHLEKSWREALFSQVSQDCNFLESQCIMDYSLLLGLHFRAPEHLKAPSEFHGELLQKKISPLANGGSVAVPSKGLQLVTHVPDSVNTMPGSHIRGSTLRASATGGEEADLLLPDTGRLRVQLGVNMPAQAKHSASHDEMRFLGTSDFCDVYYVVLYFGIIDILQEYNITKKMEHSCKALRFDPLSISAIEPKLYSRRFISFLEKIFPEEA